jgi:hypothetical protein
MDGPVTLSAAPDVNSAFVGWSGACEGTGTCQLDIGGEDVQVTATFELVLHELAVIPSPFGDVYSQPAGIECGATCTTSQPQGTVVELTASAHDGYYPAEWTGETGCGGAWAPCRVSMAQDRTVGAVFKPNPVLTVVTAGDAPGLVHEINGMTAATWQRSYPFQTIVNLEAQDTDTGVFQSWSGDCAGSSRTCALTMFVDHTVTATFVAR